MKSIGIYHQFWLILLKTKLCGIAHLKCTLYNYQMLQFYLLHYPIKIFLPLCWCNGGITVEKIASTRWICPILSKSLAMISAFKRKIKKKVTQ